MLTLSACGGDDSAGGGGSGGALTLSAANPATENTTLDLAKASTVGNMARASGTGTSPVPSCEFCDEQLPGANGRKYALQVSFRQSDKAVFEVILFSSDAPRYEVFSRNGGNPITDVTVDTAAKTVTFNNKALAGSAGELGTLSGTASLPANSTGVAACGA